MTGAHGAALDYREHIGSTLPGPFEESSLTLDTRNVEVAAIHEGEPASASPEQESGADRAEAKFRARKGKDGAKSAARSGPLIAALFLGGGTLMLLFVFVRSNAQIVLPSRNRLGGISPANVFSDAAVAAPIRPQDMLPPSASRSLPLPSATVADPSRAAVVASTATPRPSPSASPTPLGRARRLAEESENSTRRATRQTPSSNTSAVIFNEEDNDASVIVPPAEAPAPIVVNVGERLVGKLVYPVITGGGAVPATLTVVDDLVVGGRVAVPAGSRLVGQAFATTANDRAQLVVNAVVIEGRTVPMSAVAFDEDNQIGVAGKVLKKGGGLKGAGGHAVSIFSKVLSFGAGQMIPGADGLLGAAAGNAVSEANAGLAQAASQWTLSTKVVQVEAGKRVIIYLAGDLHPRGSAAAPDGLAGTEASGQ